MNVFLLYNLSLQEVFFSYIQNQSNVSISQPDYVSILENKNRFGFNRAPDRNQNPSDSLLICTKIFHSTEPQFN